MSKDSLDIWMEENTGMFGVPTSLSQRQREREEAVEYQIESFGLKKRLVYRCWHFQKDGDSFDAVWMNIGDHEVNDQGELFELVEKLEKKYDSEIRTSLVKRNW